MQVYLMVNFRQLKNDFDEEDFNAVGTLVYFSIDYRSFDLY